MHNGLYITATGPMTGKSAIALGAMQMLSRSMRKVAFFRPIINEPLWDDRDPYIHLMLEYFKLNMYALPYELYEELRIRRYGFHGTSHKYIANATAQFLGKPLSELRSITMHLGNGSSMSCVKNGKCFDTSMGLTPLEGLVMGTRCGTIDPAIVPFVMEKKGLSPAEADTLMNKKSGLLGICGYTDMTGAEGARPTLMRCAVTKQKGSLRPKRRQSCRLRPPL